MSIVTTITDKAIKCSVKADVSLPYAVREVRLALMHKSRNNCYGCTNREAHNKGDYFSQALVNSYFREHILSAVQTILAELKTTSSAYPAHRFCLRISLVISQELYLIIRTLILLVSNSGFGVICGTLLCLSVSSSYVLLHGLIVEVFSQMRCSLRTGKRSWLRSRYWFPTGELLDTGTGFRHPSFNHCCI